MDLSRRHVLGLGAVALGALRLPATANAKAASHPPLFELGVGKLNSTRWQLTKPLRAPDRFDLVGLRWNPGAHVEAQVRARVDGGRWTRWTALPHPHVPLDGTDPAFTGTADELQFRLRGEARQLTARFVRALGDAPRNPKARASQAAPFVIPRASWGADQVPPRSGPSYGAVQAAFVHHTAGTIEYGPEQSPGIVLGIARYHIQSNGWNDIGYNFLVDRYGNVFEGRAGGIEAAVIGAQAQGFNDDTTGIACLGTFTALPLDEAGFDALARIIGWKLSIHGIPVNGQVTLISGGGSTTRYPAGTPVVFERISGHRDSNQTTCPGDQLYAQLPTLRTRASRYAFAASGITVKAASQKGAQPVSVSGPAALRRRLLARGRRARRRVHDRRERLDPDRHHQRRPRRLLGDEHHAPRHRPGPRRVRRRRHPPAAGVRPGVDQGRAEHDADDGQAARQGGHRVRGRRHPRPPRRGGWNACSSARFETVGCGCSASASTCAAAPTEPRCARRRRVSTASRSSRPASPAAAPCAPSAEVFPRQPTTGVCCRGFHAVARCRTRSGPPVIGGSSSCWPPT